MSAKMKCALITGAAQGIGRCLTESFLAAGYAVAAIDNDAEAGEELFHDLSAEDRLRFINCDVSNEESVRDMVRLAVDSFASIDILINNAATSSGSPVTELSIEEWDRVLGVNLTGPFLCAKHAAPHLKKSCGSIINIASTRALMSEQNTEAYSATKGGVLALTHALAISLGPDIRVNSISPGWIEVSDFKKKRMRSEPVHSEADLSQHPVGRVGKPSDIAQCALYLSSDAAGFITGQNIVIDGGMTKKMIYV
jgi:NAD(P)-dependent dehydrogenase (short-subunit alcohol dehydrogenase family)